MHWTTLYIKGKSGFKPPVLARLKGIILHGSSQPDHDVLMVWTRGSNTLRSLKLAVGADVIFRYRLQFFADLNGPRNQGDHGQSAPVNPGEQNASANT